MSKTVKIFNKNGTFYGEYDYIDYLKFKVRYLEMVLENNEPELYIENKHGGRDKISEFGNSVLDPFEEVMELLPKIIDLQIEVRGKQKRNI